jgi:WD repeat-containing protein 61
VRALGCVARAGAVAGALTDHAPPHPRRYDAEHGALLESMRGHGSWVLSVAATPDGSSFASGGADGAVKVWDVATRACTQTLASEHTDLVWGVAFSPDGALLASCADDKAVALYAVS